MNELVNFSRHGKLFRQDNNIIAVLRYQGKNVKATAKCAPGDTFNLAFGRRLATARCAQKVAYKRATHAFAKYQEARQAFEQASAALENAEQYYNDAFDNKQIMDECVDKLLETI